MDRAPQPGPAEGMWIDGGNPASAGEELPQLPAGDPGIVSACPVLGEVLRVLGEEGVGRPRRPSLHAGHGEPSPQLWEASYLLKRPSQGTEVRRSVSAGARGSCQRRTSFSASRGHCCLQSANENSAAATRRGRLRGRLELPPGILPEGRVSEAREQRPVQPPPWARARPGAGGEGGQDPSRGPEALVLFPAGETFVLCRWVWTQCRARFGLWLKTHKVAFPQQRLPVPARASARRGPPPRPGGVLLLCS